MKYTSNDIQIIPIHHVISAGQGELRSCGSPCIFPEAELAKRVRAGASLFPSTPQPYIIQLNLLLSKWHLHFINIKVNLL